MKSTRERILEESLNLFSQKGYQSVSVREIAKALGIKAPSLYKHFESKQAILDSLLLELDKRYSQFIENLQMNGKEGQQDFDFFQGIDERKLVETTLVLFKYFLQDPYMVKFRKMLRIGRFSDSQMADLYRKQYIQGPLQYQSQLFSMLKETDLSIEDVHSAALQFYAPIYLLMEEYDLNPDRRKEIMEILEKHIQAFFRTFSRKESL